MNREFTGQYVHAGSRKTPIYVGDLVTLSIPRKERLLDSIVFEVVKDRNGFAIIYHSGAMSDGDPNYKQELRGQVYKVIGNIESGINETFLE